MIHGMDGPLVVQLMSFRGDSLLIEMRVVAPHADTSRTPRPARGTHLPRSCYPPLPLGLLHRVGFSLGWCLQPPPSPSPSLIPPPPKGCLDYLWLSRGGHWAVAGTLDLPYT